MRRRTLLSLILGCVVPIISGSFSLAFGQISENHLDSPDSTERQNPQRATSSFQAPPTARKPSELAERIFNREKQQVETIENTAPIVETYIQEEKPDALMGTLPKKDLYFLGKADFLGKTMKVHSMTVRTKNGSVMWSYNPAGFLQMAFLDLRDFDYEHYRLIAPQTGQREFLGEVRCYVFDLVRAPKAKGPRFRGRIWVEDRDFTIVRINGTYAPESSFR